MGEFNIWSTARHQLKGAGHCLQAVTALRVDSNDQFLFTGNSLGYIQVRGGALRVQVRGGAPRGASEGWDSIIILLQ